MRINSLSSFGTATFILAISFNLNASDGSPTFCVFKFGEGAYVTYEPIEINRGWSIADHIFGKPNIRKPERMKPPTGFRCGVEPAANDSKKCPPGMQLNKKRSGTPACLSGIFKLRELCPTEIETGWPELKEKICNSEK